MSYYSYWCLAILISIGWILNIMAVIGNVSCGIFTALTIARCFGIFIPPLGAVLGWFGFLF